jgi:putative toxin-antitoxin system antitoxin component (TIGR02293 family)
MQPPRRSENRPRRLFDSRPVRFREIQCKFRKASLGAVARHVYGASPDAAALMQRVIPSATFHPRGEDLKPQEGERVERLARVIATAEHVWDNVDEARAFLSTGHAMLGGKRPIEVALTELGARRVENLLWSLFHGVAA